MLKSSTKFTVKYGKLWHENGILFHSAALSYYSILSLIPVVFLLFSFLLIFKGWGESTDVQGYIRQFLLQNLSTSAGPSVAKFIETFIDGINSLNVSLISIPFLLITVLGLLTNVEISFNEIWDIKTHRSYLRRFLGYLAISVVGIIFATVSIVIGVRVHQLLETTVLNKFEHTVSVTFLEQMFMFGFPLFLTFITFTSMYKFIPNKKVPWKGAVLGGLFCGVLFEIFKNSFTIYMTRAILYKEIYGSFVSIPFFFIWIYTVWIVILSGAVLCRVINEKPWE
ncbi:MAG: YihY/virulence factor BrkB family protein [Bacteriovoracaceae bacterium]|nr:YihY/virulence factor BrkB family protein [Bacteriovoracaceae bacterium]